MITRPDCDARTGVPFGTAMSTPACRRPQRWPNGDTTGPFAGQIRPPDPRLIGALALPPPPPPEAPAADACAARMRARTAACSRSSAFRSPSRCARSSRAAASRPRRLPRASASALCRSTSRELAQLVGQLLGLALELAHAGDDRAVLLGDPVEERGAVEHVREPVGLEDHREDVRLVVLVDRDESRGQDLGRLLQASTQPHQPVLRDLEPVLHALHLRALLLQRTLQLLLA